MTSNIVTANCSRPIGLPDRSRFEWVRLNPGQGVIVRCRSCRELAHSKDIPAGHGDYSWDRHRFLVGEIGLHWAEVHQCKAEEATEDGSSS